MNLKWWDFIKKLWEVKFDLMYPVIDKIFGTEQHTHHHYHGGHWEASIRKRSRKQCRISHHQDMKCFCLCVSFAAGRGLVLRSGFSIQCIFFSQLILAKDHCLHCSTFLPKRTFSILSIFSSSPPLVTYLNGPQVFISVCIHIMLPVIFGKIFPEINAALHFAWWLLKIQGSPTYFNMLYMLLMWEIRIDCWMVEELSATRNTALGKMKRVIMCFFLKGTIVFQMIKKGCTW